MIRNAIVTGATVLAWSLAAPASAEVDWTAAAGVEEIQALTTDEDGSARETTIWLLVLDGQGYIRTSQSTTWGGNVERNPDIALRIEGQEYALRASFVTDEPLRERIGQGFREKYGWTDGVLDIFRAGDARIMRMDPR